MSSSIVKIFVPILTLRLQVHFLPLLSLLNTEDISFIIPIRIKAEGTHLLSLVETF